MFDWPRIDAIPGWLQRQEGELLYNLARDWPGEGATVELGSYQGRSTACLASGLRDSGRLLDSVVAVDTHRGSPEHQPGGRFFQPGTLDGSTGLVDTFPLFQRNMQAIGVADRVEPWRMGSARGCRQNLHSGQNDLY